MILDEIVAFKKQQLAQETKPSYKQLEQIISGMTSVRNFKQAIKKSDGSLKLIAEIKQASPSKGLLATKFCPKTMAKNYTIGGASAISVLTETKYFRGSPKDLQTVSNATSLPVLRKDFILEPYQILESRAIKADAILLIAAILTKKQLKSYISLAEDLSLCPLIEVHNRSELEMALEVEATVIGINNRNLQTFEVDINTTFTLLSLVPSGKIVVSESGITHENIKQIKAADVDAVLVGEAIVAKDNRQQAIRELLA